MAEIARLAITAQIETDSDDLVIGNSPSPIYQRPGRRPCSGTIPVTPNCEERDLKRQPMTRDRDPFADGERAARENIPAEANPYQDGSDEHALWAAGHEKIANAREASESEDT
jgi:hypothetical protein